VKVHSGAWNVELDLAGLRLSGVEFDSGTGNIECTLPRPAGLVPITVSSGIVKVSLHRPPRTAAHAVVHGGSIRVSLDGRAIRVSGSDVQWQSEDAYDARDHYELTVHSGCVRVTLDDTARLRDLPDPAPPATASVEPTAISRAAVDLLLDGIEQHIARSSKPRAQLS
jgi:hypothetical protein